MAKFARALVAVAALALPATAQAAPQAAAMKVKVIGWAAIYKNAAHRVSAPNNGVLKRCDEPGGISIVVEVSSIARGLPYTIAWSLDGKTVSTKTGAMGSFDAVPDRIYSGYHKGTLADGVYRWKLTVAGKVRATGKVTRRCG